MTDYGSRVIEKIIPLLKAGDPFIITESLYYVDRLGFRIKEVPIIFTDRRAGQTKMSRSIIFEAMVNVWKFRK